MRVLFLVALLAAPAHADGAYAEVGAWSGVFSHRANGEGMVVDRGIVLAGIRGGFGIGGRLRSGANLRIGPSIDFFTGSDSNDLMLGLAVRVDWPVSCWHVSRSPRAKTSGRS